MIGRIDWYRILTDFTIFPRKFCKTAQILKQKRLNFCRRHLQLNWLSRRNSTKLKKKQKFKIVKFFAFWKLFEKTKNIHEVNSIVEFLLQKRKNFHIRVMNLPNKKNWRLGNKKKHVKDFRESLRNSFFARRNNAILNFCV